jgi:hypothetical protein
MKKLTIWQKAAEYMDLCHYVACAALSAAGASPSDLDLFANYFKPPGVYRTDAWWPHPSLSKAKTETEQRLRRDYRVFALLLMHEITKGKT